MIRHERDREFAVAADECRSDLDDSDFSPLVDKYSQPDVTRGPDLYPQPSPVLGVDWASLPGAVASLASSFIPKKKPAEPSPADVAKLHAATDAASKGHASSGLSVGAWVGIAAVGVGAIGLLALAFSGGKRKK